jgi:hypothetical protein
VAQELQAWPEAFDEILFVCFSAPAEPVYAAAIAAVH